MGALRRNFNAGHDRRRWLERAVFDQFAPETALRVPGGGPAASADFDFANNRIYVKGTATSTLAAFLTCARATPALTYYTNADGSLRTFAPNTPRIGNQGLLVEEERANLVIHSQEFDHASWSKSNATVVADVTEAPDTTSTADRVTFSNTGAFVSDQNVPVSNIPYTLTVYAKLSSGTATFKLGMYDGIGVQLSSAFTTTGIWQRFSFTATPQATATCHFYIDSGTNSTGAIYFWGFQGEAGTFPTSYIPTTTVSVTRAAEDVRFSSMAWNTILQGTYYGEVIVPIEHVANPRIWATTSGREVFGPEGVSDNRMISYDGGGIALAPFAGVGGWSTGGRAAFAHKVGEGVSNCFNAGTVLTDTDDFAFDNKMSIIGSNSGVSDFLNGYVRRLAYWDTRLPDTDLQVLTDPDRVYSWAPDADATAALDLDFTGNRAFSNGTESTAASLITCGRTGPGYAEDTAGVLHLFGAHVPRITTKGLLCEAGSTNLFISSNFDLGGWTSGGLPTLSNVTTAPDETQTGFLVIGNRSSENAMRYDNGATLASNTTYTISVYGKYIDAPFLYIRNGGIDDGASTPNASAWFNIQTGVVGTKGSGVTSSSIQALTNGWYRCIMTATTQVGAITNNFIDIGYTNADNNSTGTPGRSIYLWGSQLEQSAHASSLITTTGTTATRSFDGNWIQPWFMNPSFNYQQTTGTWFAYGVPVQEGVDARMLGGAGLGLNGSNTPFSYNGSVNLFAFLGSGTGSTTGCKLAVSFTPTSRHLCGNAGTITTDATYFGNAQSYVALGTTVNFIEGADMNGFLKRATFWHGVSLTDAKLTSLTTL